jgi:uncharacterized protein YggE
MDPVQPISSSTQPIASPPKDSRMTMRFGGGPKQYLIYALLGLAGVIVVGFLWTWVTSPMILTVTGNGEVSVPAEAATVTFSLSASGQSAAAAAAGVKAKAANIGEVLMASGITEEDIYETQVSVVPVAAMIQGGTGYQASISMGAKTVHVSSVNDLVSTLYSSGATIVSQPIVSVENESDLEQEAFNEALRDAKNNAGKIALKNFKFIRKIVAMTQITSPTTTTVTSKADILTSTDSEAAALNGVFKIRKTVSVTYKMW